MVCSECSLDVLTVYSVFVLESKDMNVKLTYDFKMSIGMNGYLLFCVSPAVDLWYVQGVLHLLPDDSWDMINSLHNPELHNWMDLLHSDDSTYLKDVSESCTNKSMSAWLNTSRRK